MSISALAESLGLSISTVSRALNGYTDVSARTRERVQAAAKAIGYQPHPVAHRLATGRTGAIALVSSLRSGNYLDVTFSALLASVSEALRPRGYFALSLVLPTGDDELPELERLLAGRLVDGVILARTRTEDPRVSLLQQRGLPFITHGRTQGNAPHAWVDADNVQAFFLATERLAGLGHRRIALINGHPQMTFAALREQGFAQAMHTFGLDPAACPVRHGEPTAADGFRIASDLIAENHARHTPGQGNAAGPVTAMLCATDAMALGAMAAIRAAGLVVGRTISVMGYGNSEAGFYAEPPLSTIDHAMVDNGHHLVQLLLKQLQGGAPASSHLTHLAAVSLIVRQSDGPCLRTPPT